MHVNPVEITALAQAEAVAPRYDIYVLIHKALRAYMVDTLLAVGQLDVDDELLAVAPLVVEHPVPAEAPDAGDDDILTGAISGAVGRRGGGRRILSDRRSACEAADRNGGQPG